MASDNFKRLWVFPQQLSGTFAAVLMIDAVESITANALVDPLIGPGISCGLLRHLTMKSGIENGDLRNPAQNTFNNLHALEFSPDMQWGERRNTRDRRAHLGRYDYRILEVRAPVDDTVPHRFDLANRTDSTGLPVARCAQ